MSNRLTAVAGDIGYVIEVDTGTQADGTSFDWSGATATIEVLRQNGSTATWVASVSGRTLSYTTASGDLDLVGLYLLQPRVTFGDGRRLTLPKAFALEVTREV